MNQEREIGLRWGCRGSLDLNDDSELWLCDDRNGGGLGVVSGDQKDRTERRWGNNPNVAIEVAGVWVDKSVRRRDHGGQRFSWTAKQPWLVMACFIFYGWVWRWVH